MGFVALESSSNSIKDKYLFGVLLVYSWFLGGYSETTRGNEMGSSISNRK